MQLPLEYGEWVESNNNRWEFMGLLWAHFQRGMARVSAVH